ncbi:MAG: hypothetical protein KDD83_11910, partial [Caldilineaceae bacterium]|nr:hypothetical protein [Caldilineaceae bacterium]
IRSGSGNDIDPLVTVVLSAPGNTTGVTNYIVNGYGNSDVNMDGRTIAAGGGNDINFIINNVLDHPGNGLGNANYIINEQLP